ncbi:MAG: mandelate racemase/muconate lactonizing enzyme family protein [Candidatus Helarchaeota archaeon]
MKIEDIVPEWFEWPLTIKIGAMPKFKITGSVVKVVADEGYTGIAGTHFVNSDNALVAHINRWKKFVIKQDPFNIEKIWRDLYNNINRILLGIPHAISVIDCALWDLVGKVLNKPVYKILGGFRSKIPAYASLPWWVKPRQLESYLNGIIERGFNGVKVRIGKDLEWDTKVLEKARDLGGNDFHIMADVNSGYNFRQALKIGRICERLDLDWLEEPVPSDDLLSSVELRRKLDVPIAGGENDAFLYRFREILDKRAYDIIQPDVTRCGGITEVKKIAALAETYGIECTPHIFGFGPIQFANLQVIGAIPNCNWMEYSYIPQEFLMTNAIEIDKDGNAVIPELPGLGFEFDENGFNKYKQ